jgi:hypothetical protein
MRLFALVPDGGLFRWVAATAAKRWVGVLLAGYALATDGLIGGRAMDFGLRGLLDGAAHLATALVILGALIRVRAVPPDRRFGWTMLACAVLIDLDHLPGEFGSQWLTSGTYRPYPHALWTVLALTLAWAIARFFVNRAGRARPATVEFVLAGAACGVAAHFVRDIATAPMSFWWPVSDMAVEVPYWWYVAALAVMIAIGPVRRGGRSGNADMTKAMERRDMIGRLRAADPFIGTVGEPLVLPDRHRRFEFVDQRVARVEGLRPVRAGHADDHRQVTHAEATSARLAWPVYGSLPPHHVVVVTVRDP